MTSTISVPRAISDAEREKAHLHLEQTQNCMIGSIKGLSPAQWMFSPAPDCWSIAQISEHVLIVLGLVSGPTLDNLAQAPPPLPDHDHRPIDAIVFNRFTNRLAKFKSPEFAHPAGRLQTPEEALSQLATNYARLAERLDATPDLREHLLPAPPLKAVSERAYELMDGYQWIVAAGAHTERHAKQILELKAESGFPIQ